MALADILPFPCPLSIGTDICHIPRIRQILTNEHPKHADKFSRRIFSPVELPAFQVQYDKLLQLRQIISARTSDEENGDYGSGVDNGVQDSKYERELWKLSNWVAGR